MITDTEFSGFVCLSMIIRLLKHVMNKRNLIWALKAARHTRGARISCDLGAKAELKLHI